MSDENNPRNKSDGSEPEELYYFGSITEVDLEVVETKAFGPGDYLIASFPT